LSIPKLKNSQIRHGIFGMAWAFGMGKISPQRPSFLAHEACCVCIAPEDALYAADCAG
jgi:hypothetical protein